MKNFSMILAIDSKNGLGKNNTLAWRIKEDMKYFQEITEYTKDFTKFNAVIMGRKTWESIPPKFRPLPNRINCILSREIKEESLDSKIDDFVLYFNSLNSCFGELTKKDNLENIFIIGGSYLYNFELKNPFLKKIYITKIEGDFDCDVFFDGIPNSFDLESKSEIKEENGIKFSFEVWKNQDIS